MRDPRFEDDDRDRVMDAEELEYMLTQGIGFAPMWFPLDLKVLSERGTEGSAERNPGIKAGARPASRGPLTEETT